MIWIFSAYVLITAIIVISMYYYDSESFSKESTSFCAIAILLDIVAWLLLIIGLSDI